MKKILLLSFLLAIAGISQAQFPWRIRVGGKTILHTTGEDRIKNIATIKLNQLSPKNNLTLTYKMAVKEKDWKRTLIVDDSTGAGIINNPPLVKKGAIDASFIVNGKLLRELLLKYKKIQFSYTSIPSDPKKAMLVRVRPVHIVTITL